MLIGTGSYTTSTTNMYNKYVPHEANGHPVGRFPLVRARVHVHGFVGFARLDKIFLGQIVPLFVPVVVGDAHKVRFRDVPVQGVLHQLGKK
jgi:hypothetical protein